MGISIPCLVLAVLFCVPTLCAESRVKLLDPRDSKFQDSQSVEVVNDNGEVPTIENYDEEFHKVSIDGTTRSPVTTSTEGPPTTVKTSTSWHLILPGTKWCGPGNIAENDDDLGRLQDVDRCCRAHDKCDDKAERGAEKFNLSNNSSFTMLNCECDDEFYNCLQRIGSNISNMVGNIFFNILKRPCYELGDQKTKKCKKYKLHSKLICLEYEDDASVEKIIKWRQAKKYKKLSS